MGGPRAAPRALLQAVAHAPISRIRLSQKLTMPARAPARLHTCAAQHAHCTQKHDACVRACGVRARRMSTTAGAPRSRQVPRQLTPAQLWRAIPRLPAVGMLYASQPGTHRGPQWGRCVVDLGPLRGRFGVDPWSIWVGAGSHRGRIGAAPASTLDRFGVNPWWIWDRPGCVEPVRGR